MPNKIKLLKFIPKNKSIGFTVLEILLIIMIIGILLSVIIINLNISHAKDRDSKRMQDLEQFMRGLEIYYGFYDVYPCGDTDDPNPIYNPKGTHDSSDSSCHGSNDDTSGFLNGVGTLGKVAQPQNCIGYSGGLFSIGVLDTSCPLDPINDAYGTPALVYWYTVSADRQLYVLSAYLENNDTLMANDGGLCPSYYEVGSGVGVIKMTDDPSSHLGKGCNA